MGWSVLSNGFIALGNRIYSGVIEFGQTINVAKFTKSLLQYTANTLFQTLEQGLALRHAVPTLINNHKARTIVNGMGYMIVYDVFPLWALYAANNKLQHYTHDHYVENASWYQVFTLTCIDYAVTAFTWRQGIQSFSRMLVLDSLGPYAFNSNKLSQPNSLCVELNCTGKRRIKGWAREPFILMANEALVLGIGQLPYLGSPLATVAKIYLTGRYITRIATPERCERHKEMMQESVLSLGLGYEATSLLMERFFIATIGMPPYLYYRTMCHLLLLLHISIAAHMNLPRQLSNEVTVFFDPFNAYEQFSRFLVDVLFAGLKVRIPIDFKFDARAQPIISLSAALQFGTKILNSDKITANSTHPGFFKRTTKTLQRWVLPAMFHNVDAFINDKIIAAHWVSIQEGVTNLSKDLKQMEQSPVVNFLINLSQPVTKAVCYIKWGIPGVVVGYGIKLSNEKDFWLFTHALRDWFERHTLHYKVLFFPAQRRKLYKPMEEVAKSKDTNDYQQPTKFQTNLPEMSADYTLEPLSIQEVKNYPEKELANPAQFFSNSIAVVETKQNIEKFYAQFY